MIDIQTQEYVVIIPQAENYSSFLQFSRDAGINLAERGKMTLDEANQQEALKDYDGIFFEHTGIAIVKVNREQLYNLLAYPHAEITEYC